MVMAESTGGGQEEKPFSFSVGAPLLDSLKTSSSTELCRSSYTVPSDQEPDKLPLSLSWQSNV